MSRRDLVALVVIWSFVLTGAVLIAALGADDDPNTHEAAGAGALASVTGTVLTGVYFAVRERRPGGERQRL